MVKNVSRFCDRFGSDPINGLSIETRGSGVSVGSWHIFRCNFTLLKMQERSNIWQTCQKLSTDMTHLINKGISRICTIYWTLVSKLICAGNNI